MDFILNGKKVFGDELHYISDIIETNGIELSHEETEMLVDMVVNDELPDKYYHKGILNMDKISNDPECLEDLVKDYWI